MIWREGGLARSSAWNELRACQALAMRTSMRPGAGGGPPGWNAMPLLHSGQAGVWLGEAARAP